MTSHMNMVGQYMQKKEEDKRIAEDQVAKDRYWKIPICYDDDDDEESSIPLKDIIISGLPPCVAITPVLLTEEPVDSLIMEDEHLDTIPATESDEVIKSSVEDLVPILSESEGISDSMCDVPFCDNSTPLEVLKDHSEIFINSNDDDSLSDDNSLYGEDIDYVEASPPDSELVSLEVVEIVIPEVGGIDTDILLTIKDDILREKLLNVNLLIAKIEALKDNPIPSSDFVTKSSSTSLNFFLEETNTFDNSLPESETFCFNLEEISSGSPTSYSDLSLPDYEAFFCDSEPDSGNFTMDVVEDIFDNPTREPRSLSIIRFKLSIIVTAPPAVVEPFNLEEPIENPHPPVVTMADNRTMAQLLDLLNSVAGGNFLDKMPRDCLRIIESKSKVRNSRTIGCLPNVNSSTSTTEFLTDVSRAERIWLFNLLLIKLRPSSSAPQIQGVRKKIFKSLFLNVKANDVVNEEHSNTRQNMQKSEAASFLAIEDDPTSPEETTIARYKLQKDLKNEEKAALIEVLKSHKRAIAWKLFDIKGINPEFCTHKILMEEDYELTVQHQRRVNPKIHDVIKKEVKKLLDAGFIYPISDSPWGGGGGIAIEIE
ncbi:hypothetical protein Tco_0655547 [Tanacetum coccineum]|uniref:Reverse transcriptase domain-containing protein n=1 Tax=Tanacetum coccineum TaxID=301880 RepID=A0ABQ4X6B0_9ASTR